MSKIAYVFPGQGAQYFGMGKDFYENFEDSKELFNNASEILKYDVADMCFNENDKLNMTEYTQAAMLTACSAILLQINKKKLNPAVCAGLSLGEYAALLACESLSFEDAVYVVRQRGILMTGWGESFLENTGHKSEGGMYAVLGLDENIIKKICDETEGIVSIANYNCPGQIVITGEIGALERAKESCLDAGAKRAIMLNVSGPFHSLLLKPAGEKLTLILNNIEIRKPKIPYVANVNAEYIREEKSIKELLSKQVYSPVKWIQSVEAMIADGVDTFIEIGPGKTISALIKKINRDVKVINIDKADDLEKISEVI